MKKTKIIGALIFILIIFLFIILTAIASITMLGNESNANKIFNNSLNNDTSNVTNNTVNNNSNVQTFSFELQGITSEMEQYIKDVNKLSESVKQYIYKYGFFDVTVAEVEKYEYQESTGRLGIIFKLNNLDENKLRVIINANGNIDISNYN